MVESDIIGMWKAEKSISADGKEKPVGMVKISMDFAEGGTAHVKIAFLKADAKWEIKDGKLSVANAKNGTAYNLDLVDDRLVMTNEDGSKAILARA